MKNLLAFLLAFFRLGVGDGDDQGADDQAGADDGAAGGDDQGADDGAGDDQNAGADDQGGDDGAPDTAAELEAERRGRQQDRERADRLERELGEMRAGQQRKPDPTQEEEERILRDPQATDLQKWQVRSNQEIRASRLASQGALAQAHDIADKTSFGQLAITNPDVHKRYEARVEQEYQKLVAKGTPAPRAAILRVLIGDDVLNKKLTPKKAAAAAKPGVNRGKMPGARSDVNGKNSMSEREKRRARLENVQI